MFGLGDFADWWDEQKNQSQQILDDWVFSSASNGKPDYFAIAIATAATTSMELGAGFVDVLRLGEGVNAGGWGYAQDGLRLLIVAGPTIRVGRMGLTRLTADINPSAGVCGWVSMTQALRQTGVKHFAIVDDLARAAGVEISALGGTNIGAMLNVLRSMGASARIVRVSNGISSLRRLAQSHVGDVIQFGVTWVPPGATQPVGHALYIFKNSLGRVKIVDRSGRVVDSLADLANYYPGIETAAVLEDAILISRSAVVRTSAEVATLALEVNSVALRSRQEMDGEFSKRRKSNSSGGAAQGD